MSILTLENIRKSYPDGEGGLRTVLGGVSLSLERGEFIAVTGPSGSGKTTLLRIAGTLLEPDSGKVFIDGQEISPGEDHSLIRNRKIGFVFQDHRLLPQLTVLQNVLLPALASAEKVPSETEKYALSLLEYAGISSLSGKYPSAISGGEGGRVALCRALVMKPAIILADEPTGQLDHENALKIASLLGKVCDDFGTGVVMVTHSDEVAAVASRKIGLSSLND
ncbi:MAG: ABC transporter ATP-binding protein [Bacteroidales bacterium]|nr:ABC transporter ATP-binding protein [Bacteroidales bacterium]MBQ9174053.1 ABC transporter ATP-binding protein [Bacteroidales bacterium]MBQ9712759.1 ABC transporter ATP-binding protein [Bacteroidales bacterium]MBR1433551.1 ABC transporter ATP-binding protein [Bacteroidales bacterium]